MDGQLDNKCVMMDVLSNESQGGLTEVLSNNEGALRSTFET